MNQDLYARMNNKIKKKDWVQMYKYDALSSNSSTDKTFFKGYLVKKLL
jgi:hypothetical protein